ncbi:MAG: heme exporter protein CcmB [Selenomonadaceae bacterium]|nr:heme exporter protein CcmB [Selenomonadaceae bacterium]
MQSSIFHGIKLVFQKELLAGMRFKAAWSTIFMFALTTLSCVSLALQGVALEPKLQAVLFWIVLFFSSMTGMDRCFADEEMSGTLFSLKLYGKAQAVLFGKMIYMFFLLLLLALFVSLLFFIFLDVGFVSITEFLAVAFAGILGLSGSGTFIAALTTGASVKSGLFSVLMLPVILPIFLPAIFLTGMVFSGDPIQFSHLGGMLLYDLLLMVGASVLFDYFWYEE